MKDNAKGKVTGRPPRRRDGRRSMAVVNGDARRAFALRQQGFTYAEIATRLGCSLPWAYRLVQRPIAAASPKALGTALARCDVLLRLLAGSDLDTVLRLQARLRTLVAQRA